jgi:hypothetical protein
VRDGAFSAILVVKLVSIAKFTHLVNCFINKIRPFLTLGATQALGLRTSHLTAYRNDTGRVTFLQSTQPSMSYGNLDYCTQSADYSYARAFENVAKNVSTSNDCNLDKFLSVLSLKKRYHFDSHNVLEHTQGQTGVEWHFACAYTISSTVSYAVTPRDVEMLTRAEQSLLKCDIEEKLVSQSAVDEEAASYLEFQMLSSAALNKLTVDKLKDICKHYQQTYYNKRKAELIEQVKKGPKVAEDMTEEERFLKKTLLAPLADKDRSAWRLGSLNEDKVRSVISAIVSGVGGEFIDG